MTDDSRLLKQVTEQPYAKSKILDLTTLDHYEPHRER
ncbi:hypothetical protein BH11PLA2_BH11PLA2_41570 [soil metagenome]